ncbi:hypothetical protein C0J52_22290 [Blattella germanica]|nr:hypothetical protein C0J52_22290 [Blattella germanica]
MKMIERIRFKNSKDYFHSLPIIMLPEEVAKAVALSEDGRSVRYIAGILGIARSTIHDAIRRYNETRQYSRRQESGRPKSTNRPDDRFSRLTVLRNRRLPATLVARRLAEVRNVVVSARTIRRRLREYGLVSRRPSRGPELLAEHRVARLQFVRQHINWDMGAWESVLFTDESRFALRSADGRERTRQWSRVLNCKKSSNGMVREEIAKMSWNRLSPNATNPEKTDVIENKLQRNKGVIGTTEREIETWSTTGHIKIASKRSGNKGRESIISIQTLRTEEREEELERALTRTKFDILGICESCVYPVQLYGCQTWTLTSKLKNKIGICQRKMQRKILGVTRRDRIPNTVLRQRTQATEIEHLATSKKWKWGGHVTRLQDNRWTYKTTVWDPRLGKMTQGRPRQFVLVRQYNTAFNNRFGTSLASTELHKYVTQIILYCKHSRTSNSNEVFGFQKLWNSEYSILPINSQKEMYLTNFTTQVKLQYFLRAFS